MHPNASYSAHPSVVYTNRDAYAIPCTHPVTIVSQRRHFRIVPHILRVLVVILVIIALVNVI